MAINKASLIVVEVNWLPDSTTVASLAILLKSFGETQMPTMVGLKVRGVTTKAAVLAMV